METELKPRIFAPAFLSLIAIVLPAAARTTDLLRFGDPASEQAHGLNAQASETGTGALGQPLRRFLPLAAGDWRGGSASFRLKVRGDAPNYLTVRLWGEEVSGNQATLYCDGKQLGYRQLSDIDILDQGGKYPAAPGRFHYITHPLPEALTRGKREIACTMRITGPVWRYGGEFSSFQQAMKEPSRGFYALMVHSEKMAPLDKVEGRAPAAPVNTDSDSAVLERVKRRVDGQLEKLWTAGSPANQLQISFLAKTYETPWSKGYQSPRNLAAILAGIDAIWELYKADHRIAYEDKATPNPGWFGLGLAGHALKITAPVLRRELDATLANTDGTQITRRKALETMFADSRKWNKEHRRLFTNQSMIKDLYGIWNNNEGLIAIGSPLAEPREKLLPFLYESVGLLPWSGSRNANDEPTYAAAEADAKFSVPKNYYQTTAKGLTRELGYVGGYGEVLDWVVDIYDATRPAKGLPGDSKIRAQLVKIAQARAWFRYPHWDANGKRAMRLEAAAGWRDLYSPSDVIYGQRPSWDASPLQSAVATGDPVLQGYAQQMLADGQFFPSVDHMLESATLRATIGLIPVVEEYEALRKLPPQPYRLPMSAGQPDFVFSDEEDGVVALKHGNDILYASLYWRANYGISGKARVHYITPVTDRVATVMLDRQEYEASGLFYIRPDNPHLNGTRFTVRYPDDGPVWTAGEKQPVAKLPEGTKYVPGEDNSFAGRADYYQLTYGPYLIAMNSSKGKTFKVSLPQRAKAVRELVRGTMIEPGTHTLELAAGSTVVVYLGEADVPVARPRLVAGAEQGRDALAQRIAKDSARARQLAALKARVQPYVDRHRSEPDWVVSRLQMYWQSHATNVYVKSGFYDHADGRAPVPTVRFSGARDSSTAYLTPKLEDVKPYMGEGDKLYLQNRSIPGQPWEWAAQSKTGVIIQNINMRIAELARDAAFLYWYTGDETYARFAYDIFDTYMTGLYHRAAPVELEQGHGQTLVGMQSFESIHEDIAGVLAESYDFIRGYALAQGDGKRAIHEAAFKKWADVILDHGVPWNNWNLIKARFVLQIAAVLQPDAEYADRRGKDYYVHAVIEGRGPRQWPLQRLLEFGYDSQTAMWNESPGYSNNVIDDYMECLELLERVAGIDLLPKMPLLPRVAAALPQYLLPNGRTVGFGDSRYDFLRTASIERLLAYAHRHGLKQEAAHYAALLSAIRSASGATQRAAAGGVHGILGEDGQAPGPQTATRVEDYQTPTFHAPNASWLIQRNGHLGDKQKALVISQVGSAGNHAHANGIAMELFAEGLSLAPESGKGSSYLQNDHLEYYSQFPAHNTVVVDGQSTYPSMKSNHPFVLQAAYPAPGSPAAGAFPLATFTDVSFTEPETNAEQRRVLATVRLGEGSGYFVDIFRSRRRDGKDRYHDYIYHNLGQAMRFSGIGGEPLSTAASDRLAFADGDLVGYDYWSRRQSLTSVHPLQASFELKLPERRVAMTAWLQGAEKREFFSVQAPPSKSWAKGMLPEGVDTMPLQTLVIRQLGEAWSHPFTAVFEAASDGATGAVQNVEEIIPPQAKGQAVALRVTAKGGERQTIISSDGAVYVHGGQRLVGRYGIAAEKNGVLDYLFLGHGREISAQGYAIAARNGGASAALWQAQGQWHYTASHPATLRVPAAWPAELTLPDGRRVRARSATMDGKQVRVFELPAMAAGRLR